MATPSNGWNVVNQGDNANLWQNLFGYTQVLDNGKTANIGGAVAPVTQLGQTVLGSWLGFQQLGLANDAFDFQKDAYNKNYDMQKSAYDSHVQHTADVKASEDAAWDKANQTQMV